MKGITPIIAIILLLLITISMVGFTFLWFGRLQEQLTSSISNETSQSLREQGTSARIEVIDAAPGGGASASNYSGTFVLRNTGTQVLQLSEVSVFVNSTILVTCGWGGGTQVPPNGVATCTPYLTTPLISRPCNTVKVTTIGTGDVRSCG